MAIRTFFDWTGGAERASEVAAKHGGSSATKAVTGYDGKERVVAGVEFAAGRVIATSSRGVRIMSDVYGDDHYAVFWDPAAGKPVEFVYATSSDVSNHYGSAEVDATPEVMEFVAAYEEGKRRGAVFARCETEAWWRAKEEADAAARAAKEAADAARKAEIVADESTPRVGDVVEVTRGNKSTPKGTTGRVFWTGWSNRGGASWRIGFKDGPGETHWIAATGVKVVEKGNAPRAIVAPPATFAAPTVSKGNYVVITAGEGEGMTGWVIWVGSDRSTGAPRVGVKDYGGTVVWTAAANVARREAA